MPRPNASGNFGRCTGLFLYRDLDAPIFLTAVRIIGAVRTRIGSDRLLSAQPAGPHTRFGNSLFYQVSLHGRRPPFRKFGVVGLRPL